MILSAWEYEPDGMIDERTIRDFTDSERAYLAIFEKLRDTVDAIPASLAARRVGVRRRARRASTPPLNGQPFSGRDCSLRNGQNPN